jgi:hypothetical protein
MAAALRRPVFGVLPSGLIRKGLLFTIHILISGAVSVNQASGVIRRPITRNSMVCAETCL